MNIRQKKGYTSQRSLALAGKGMETSPDPSHFAEQMNRNTSQHSLAGSEWKHFHYSLALVGKGMETTPFTFWWANQETPLNTALQANEWKHLQ